MPTLDRGDAAGAGHALNIATLIFVFAAFVTGAVRADQLNPPQSLARDRSVDVSYRFEKPATGHGYLDIEWSDAVGRLVERRRLPLELAAAPEVVFPLDLRRAVTMQNRLVAHLSFDGLDGGESLHRENQQTVAFVVPPPDGAWSDYQIIMWHGQSPAGYSTLKQIGITAGAVETSHSDEAHPYAADQLGRLVDADLRSYLENIATDFYSPYHKWYGDRPVNWRFSEVKQRYWKNPNDIAAFIREPSLSDRDWLRKTQDRLTRAVQALHPYRPLYYSLGDETGIGDLAAFWDFDYSAPSLAAMRDWLQQRYRSLAALNRQWGCEFDRWDDVMPLSTRDAMQRADENFSAWADFKEWMDVAFARALKTGTEAVHDADRQAVAAIEGAQIPGWGGYDYSRLADSVDAMELYDFGENVAIVRSFNPDMIMLTTSAASGPREAHRVWRELLRGTRGLILWDESHGFAGEDGRLGERGREAAPYFGEIRGGLGALLINSRRRVDPIGILYSPASMRMQWLLDRRATGEDWTRRNASTEYLDNTIRRITRNFADAFQHMGLQYRFVSSEGVQQGALRDGDFRALVLPHTIALSAREAGEIRSFVEQGGLVIADSEPGIFDEHGRRVAKPLLSDIFNGPATRSAPGFAFGKGRAIYLSLSDQRHPASTRRLTAILDGADVRPLHSVRRADGRPADDVESYFFYNGGLTIIALQRDYLAPANGATPESIELNLPRAFTIHDLRAKRTLGNTDRLPLELNSVEPIVLALSDERVAPPSIAGPRRAHLGENAEFLVRSGSPVAHAVIHLDVLEPGGSTVAHYSRNLLAAGSATAALLPFALNDKPGIWTLQARDVASGETATAELQVEP